jgi:hypothetical protein
MTDKLCPECNAVLQVCQHGDFQGRHWYWCEICDNYRHESEFDVTDEQDERQTIASLRADLY